MKPLHAEVRFHLGKGQHFKHWQIKIVQGRKKISEFYYDPAYYQLEMIGCKLINKVNQAKKVHEAGVKSISNNIDTESKLLHDKNLQSSK